MFINDSLEYITEVQYLKTGGCLNDKIAKEKQIPPHLKPSQFHQLHGFETRAQGFQTPSIFQKKGIQA